MGNEIVGFGGLNFFLIIVNELIVKCLIRFGAFVRVLKDQWK
jgi:hypothetical protein